MIIDSHAHIFPEKIAKKAVDNIGNFYNLKMTGTGLIDELIMVGKAAGCGGFIVNASATKAHQVEAINSFIIDSIRCRKNVWGLCTIHQDCSENDVSNIVENAIKDGMIGIKLHPDLQQFNIDDEKVFKIYEKAGGLLPILMHTGDARYDYSSPVRLARVAKMFPKQIFIAAHFGGYNRWQDVECYKGLDNIYFDTSSTLYKLPKEKVLDIIGQYGVDRFLFGVDYPMWNHKNEIEYVKNLDLTTEELEKLYCKNAMTVYNISPIL